MLYLILAILSSALVSITMRLSTNRIRANVAMLAMNYLMCLCLAAAFTGIRNLFPASPRLPQTLGLGAIHGVLYLASFVLLQVNVRRNGVVLPGIFMKLGLLVPMVVSIFAFGEIPTPLQAVGFCIAIAAIILINLEKGDTVLGFRAGLIALLLGGGAADAMSKVYEEIGDSSLSDQFLFYTFLVALILCIGLMVLKKQRPGKSEIFFGLLIGIPNYFSARFLLLSLDTVSAVIAYPTYSVATILLISLAGVLFFREKLSRRQWLAVAIILAALILLNT